MRFIPTRIHGILDYLVGIILIAAPWLLDFNRGGAETWVPVIIGIVILLQTIMTDFEVGMVRMIPMGTHLTMDFFIGLFLAASPWLFGFADFVWVPHVIFGVVAILASLTTHTAPAGYGRRGTARDIHNDPL
jgi:type IV secretory pathway VirB2 component (pilin)